MLYFVLVHIGTGCLKVSCSPECQVFTQPPIVCGQTVPRAFFAAVVYFFVLQFVSHFKATISLYHIDL